MPSPGLPKMLFVINPISGGKTKTEWETSIKDFFKPLPFDIHLFVLDGENDRESIAYWIDALNPAVVVAVGGDGTVSLVAKQVLGKEIALGILPAGSANGMARELGIPEDPAAAMQIIADGNTKNTDVIKINEEHICLHLSDIGLNARLIKHFEEGKLRGKWGYATKVLKTLWTKSTMKVNVITEEREVQHVALMVVLANATKYGTGAVINPVGNLYDGIFEVVIMRRLAISELFKMWFRPQPFNPRKIKIFPATSVFIQTKKRVHFQIDGEYLGKVNKVEANILKGQLKLIVP
jgi:diacylglycerol kinase (ATP)